MLVEAFVKAFNAVTAQSPVIAAMPKAQPVAAAPATSGATVAVDTVLRSAPAASAASVRALPVGTELIPTGQRNGLFIEDKDSSGTTGWVSVEHIGEMHSVLPCFTPGAGVRLEHKGGLGAT